MGTETELNLPEQIWLKEEANKKVTWRSSPDGSGNDVEYVRADSLTRAREEAEQMVEGIAEAIRLIHTDEAEGGNYDAGMRLLCQLIGRKDGWPTDVRTISIEELARDSKEK